MVVGVGSAVRGFCLRANLRGPYQLAEYATANVAEHLNERRERGAIAQPMALERLCSCDILVPLARAAGFFKLGEMYNAGRTVSNVSCPITEAGEAILFVIFSKPIYCPPASD